MGMTIAERMAMQARAPVASHQAPMKSVTKSATVSAAQRMAKQATVTKAAPPAPKEGDSRIGECCPAHCKAGQYSQAG